MLAWNQRKVRQLSALEIWAFIAGRVLAAFGVGLLLAGYVPQVVALGWPSLGCGVVLLLVAAKGLVRPSNEP
jgi:hypothetical protein